MQIRMAEVGDLPVKSAVADCAELGQDNRGFFSSKSDGKIPVAISFSSSGWGYKGDIVVEFLDDHNRPFEAVILPVLLRTDIFSDATPTTKYRLP